MKFLFLSATLLFGIISIAQPVTREEVKKYRIHKISEFATSDGETTENFWYFDNKGNDSLLNYFSDTMKVYHTFSNGRLVKKRIVRSEAADRDHVDEYTYEYDARGGYKETYRDGRYGMKSYSWYNPKGQILKSQSPDGNGSTHTYNAAGKLVSIVSDGKNSGLKINQRFTYNPKGQLIRQQSEIDGNETITTNTYDAKGRLVKQNVKENWEGEIAESVITIEYNSWGLISKKTTKKNDYLQVSEYKYEYRKLAFQ